MKFITWASVLVMLTIAFAAQSLWADTLTKKDGTVYEGKLIKKTATQYVFEVWKSGGKMKYEITVPASEVESLKEGEVKVTKPTKPEKTVPPKEEEKKKEEDNSELAGLPEEPKAPEIEQYEGPTYYPIPLNGVVGQKFVARILEKSLEDAVKRKPTVVVLIIDSPGGHISEVDKLFDVICKYKKQLRIVVYVKNEALSAAAITALAVNEIYMKTGTQIGAATSYGIGEDRLPKDVAEKFQSVWRAKARSAAEAGGHSPLIAEAMIDKEMELYVIEENGKKVVKEGQPMDGAAAVTKKGKLLTITDKEAEACGLSLGSVEDINDLGKKLGYENWTECQGLGVPLAEYWEKTIDEVEKKFKGYVDEFRENMQKAQDNDPESFDDYDRSKSGKLAPRSKSLWKSRSNTATGFLKKAEESLKKAGDLAEKFPEVLMEDPEAIRGYEKKIKLLRESIETRTKQLR